jgi:hypothetical protein
MKVTVFTKDRELGRALADRPAVLTTAGTADKFDIGPLQRVPGATESFWQLVVDIGIVSAPISIACNLIASWLYDAYTRWRDQQRPVEPMPGPLSVKLIIRTETEAVDIQLRVDDLVTIEAELERALRHDDPQQ